MAEERKNAETEPAFNQELARLDQNEGMNVVQLAIRDVELGMLLDSSPAVVRRAGKTVRLPMVVESRA